MGSFERGVIHALARGDKWSLGGEGPYLWAPSFPQHVDHLGFWDAGQFYRNFIGPLFTVELLYLRGDSMPLNLVRRRWTPAYVVQEYESAEGIRVLERKAVLPSGVLTSELRIEADHDLELPVVVWSVQPADGEAVVEVDGRCIAVPRSLETPIGESDVAWVALSAGPCRFTPVVVVGEKGTGAPTWQHSVLWELLPLDNEQYPGRGGGEGHYHIGFKTNLALTADSSIVLHASAAVATDRDLAIKRAVAAAAEDAQPIEASLQAWEEYLSQIPRFDCSSQRFSNYYWYRWFGLRLATQSPAAGHIRHRAVCEGSAYFRRPITYSVQAHLRETRWIKDPALSRDTLFSFFDAQEKSGRFAGILDVAGPVQESFYHTDWGAAVMGFLAVHPDSEVLKRAYDALGKYARWLAAERDPESSGMYTVVNHFETGQEYSSRYQAVCSDADKFGWGDRFLLKGVDATVYAYQLNRALEVMATKLARETEAQAWSQARERIRIALTSKMWDPSDKIFYDIDPNTGWRTNVKAGTCFYPFMTEATRSEHSLALEEHLLNEAEFWTEYPFPSLSLDDPLFSAEGLWNGMRMNCPWNGRSWPMLNSHLVEALAQTALRLQPSLLDKAGEALKRVINMLFFGNDALRPNSFEHYNPLNGKPSAYRGIDDYQHSWIVDLLLKYVAGLQPRTDGTLTIAPLPLGLEFVRVQDALIQGHTVDIELTEERVTDLRIDGKPAAIKQTPFTVNLEH